MAGQNTRTGTGAGKFARITLAQRLIAVAIFTLVAAALYLVDRLPASVKLAGEGFSADSRNALVLYGLPASPVMSFDGALGLGLDLRSDAARLSKQTITTLVEGGHPAPRSKAVSLTWLGQVDPQGRIALTIANERSDPAAGIAFTSTGTVTTPQLRITPVETAIRVTAQAITGDSLTAPPILLKLGGEQVQQPLATMLPLDFELTPGESLLLTFANAAAFDDAAFRLGVPNASGELASQLPLQRIEVGERSSDPSGPPIRRLDSGVCSARAGKMLLSTLKPSPRQCSDAGKLAIESLDVKAGTLSIKASGSGFVTRDGRAVAAGVLSAIANNKLVAAIMGIALATLAGWVWKTVTGIGT